MFKKVKYKYRGYVDFDLNVPLKCINIKACNCYYIRFSQLYIS